MADQYTVTTTTSYGNRVLNSFGGAVIGFFLFLGSFYLLYWNEGRVDLSRIATRQTIAVDPNVLTQPPSGKGISVTGVINSTETLGDNLFLNPDKYIAVHRSVFMYSWTEQVQSSSHTNPGGSETTQTTYSYTKKWVENPPDSSQFKYPDGHINPPEPYSSQDFNVQSAEIGVYNISPSGMYPPTPSLDLTSANVKLPPNGKLTNNQILISATPQNATSAPQIGDLEISYGVLKDGSTVTAFGALNGSAIDPFYFQPDQSLYRLFLGTRDEGIANLHSEYTVSLWLFRLLGFIMMFVGLSLMLGPISVIVDLFPGIGEITGFVISTAALVVSLVLTVVTILVSMLLHNIIALVAVIVLVLFGFGIHFWLRRKSRNVIPPPPPIVPPAPSI